MDMIHIFEALGLREKEAKIYLALLSLGESGAYRLAKKTGLKRPTAYVIVQELIEKGYIYEAPESRPQRYVARPPELLMDRMEERLEEAKSALPQLKALQKKGDTKLSALYFEGIRGLREALWYKLDEFEGKELVGFYAKAPDVDKATHELFDEWATETAKRGVVIRGFAPDDLSLERYRSLDKKFLRDMHLIPHNEYSSEISIDVMGDITRLIDINGDQHQAIVIENPRFATAVKQIFEIMWKKMK